MESPPRSSSPTIDESSDLEDRRQALYEAAYSTLHRRAARYLAGEGRHTLQPTALVHEAYLKMLSAGTVDGHGRDSFVRMASWAMRAVLVDFARRRRAAKRAGGARATGDVSVATGEAGMEAVDVLALDEAIEELEQVDPRLAQVVVLRFFGGLAEDEVAAQLRISKRSVSRDWSIARAWLRARLDPDVHP